MEHDEQAYVMRADGVICRIPTAALQARLSLSGSIRR